MIRLRILDQQTEATFSNRQDLLAAEKAELERLIKAESPNWLTEAQNRTAIYTAPATKAYSEPPKPNWSKIKRVYMNLQAHKCAYCEQKLENRNIVHQVEHYRPKKNVKAWLNAKKLQKMNLQLPLDIKDKGYYYLPYNVFNYVTSCGHCNSSRKSDYFPIAGTRITDTDDFEKLKDELPYLPYPLGNLDDDAPEDLISFFGFVPQANPNLTDSHKIHRALVTIEFFELHEREYLIKQRCGIIKEMVEAFEDIAEHPNPQRREQKIKDLEKMQKPESEHANCARCFYQLCLSNIGEAYKCYEKALQYLENNPTT